MTPRNGSFTAVWSYQTTAASRPSVKTSKREFPHERRLHPHLLDPQPRHWDPRHPGVRAGGHLRALAGGRLLKLGKFGEIKPLHEALSLATIVLVVAHGLLLIGDSWLNPGLSGIAIPFTMDYRPFSGPASARLPDTV